VRIGSLFSGIGGLELGLERAGVGQTVWQCECDDYALAVLAKHWPHAQRFRDVRAMDESTPPVDVICGGFPCQDISNAGRREGITGGRSGLFFELMRVVRMVRPRFVVLENVAALLGRGLDTVLGELSESGFDAEWDCVPASAVGAPHQRDRVFIIGVLANAARDEQGRTERRSERERTWACGESFDVADAVLNRRGIGTDEQELRHECGGTSVACVGGEVGDSHRERGQEHRSEHQLSDQAEQGPLGWPSLGFDRNAWEPEPDVGRVAHGVPSRVDRLRCLGNAVVPQVAEVVGRRLMQIAGSLAPKEPT